MTFDQGVCKIDFFWRLRPFSSDGLKAPLIPALQKGLPIIGYQRKLNNCRPAFQELERLLFLPYAWIAPIKN